MAVGVPAAVPRGFSNNSMKEFPSSCNPHHRIKVPRGTGHRLLPQGASMPPT